MAEILHQLRLVVCGSIPLCIRCFTSQVVFQDFRTIRDTSTKVAGMHQATPRRWHGTIIQGMPLKAAVKVMYLTWI